MPVYSISYDLNSPGQKHRDLANYLSSQGGIRIMETHWLFPSQKSANDIKIELQTRRLIDFNDVLLIIEVKSSNAARVNVLENAIATMLFSDGS